MKSFVFPGSVIFVFKLSPRPFFTNQESKVSLSPVQLYLFSNFLHVLSAQAKNKKFRLPQFSAICFKSFLFLYY